MNNGWVKLHRRLLDWEWYDDIPVRLVFIHLLLRANHKEKQWRGISIGKGEVVTGRFSLAEEVGLSVQSTRTALNKLKSTNEITIKSTNKYSTISINNWDSYQQDNQQPNKRLTNNQPTTNHKQEGNKDKNDKKDIYGEFKNIKLLPSEYKKLSHKWGSSSTDGIIEELSGYMASKGKTYKNHYATLLNWGKRKGLTEVTTPPPQTEIKLTTEQKKKNQETLKRMREELSAKKIL